MIIEKKNKNNFTSLKYPQTQAALIAWHNLNITLSKECLLLGRKAEAAYFLNCAKSDRRCIERKNALIKSLFERSTFSTVENTTNAQAERDAIADYRTEQQVMKMEGIWE